MEQIIKHLGQPAPSAKELQGLRAVEVLEMANTPESRKLMERLAEGVPGARLTQEAKESLGRLAKQSATP